MEKRSELKIYRELNEEIPNELVEDSNVNYDLKIRTREFAYKCYDLCEKLPNTYFGNHIKGQLFRCSSSVAANYRATCNAQSKASFISKISIVLEEIDESAYWLKFILDKEILKHTMVDFLYKESVELTAIFGKSRKTARENLKKGNVI